MIEEINKEQYKALAEFDALIKKTYFELKKKGLPAFAIQGVLAKSMYNLARTEEEGYIKGF